MTFKIQHVNWEQAHDQLCEVREKVFVCEYRIPKTIEFDNDDTLSEHVLLTEDSGKPIATGRISPKGEISRIAVVLSHRDSDAAEVVLKKLMDIAKKIGVKQVSVNCELDDVKNYIQQGFRTSGSVYMEAGIPRQRLICPINKVSVKYCRQIH
ncbi:GNAT family N-acetyltransferase [Flocculibacter collagenilyticus]|uniref:GNAT family N-acetyltransferase n=1 Tax=Flocculibacter collagenilyticus TaxID=2744479 RepID=UPI0018F699B3|nr:GNAT family N-acetyltransferase [Flocculibacter collagenilyticus]